MSYDWMLPDMTTPVRMDASADAPGPLRSFADLKQRMAAAGDAGALRMDGRRPDARRADDAEAGRRAAERARRDKEALRGAATVREDAAPTGPVRSSAELRRRHAVAGEAAGAPSVRADAAPAGAGPVRSLAELRRRHALGAG